MPLPSLWIAEDRGRAWNIARAAGYGATLGALAALFKTLAPWREGTALSAHPTANLAAHVPEIVVATLGFAILCAGASALRNFVVRRLIWPEVH